MSGFLIDMAENTITLTAISKKYPFSRALAGQTDPGTGEFWALQEVSFSASCGQIIGVIGRNGAGKSTLLNIVAGTIPATHGSVVLKGRAVGLFNLGLGFQDEFSGRQNIFLNGTLLGASRKELEEKMELIIAFSELGDFIDMPLGSYSQGMRLRLGFGIIAHLDFDVLLLDEILAVGDVLFQNKCFEKIMDLKRSGKTLIVSSQALDLIERLCDSVLLLDHGKLLYYGRPQEGIEKYRRLLATEEFFIGPSRKAAGLVEYTKQWADDISQWGKKLGTKEVAIESVVFVNRFGFRGNRLACGKPFSVKVEFNVRNSVKNPHFGVAFFRKDGVYCYGPNTDFDGIFIPELKVGKGSFHLACKSLFFAPGQYLVSVAVWDSSEKIAFDYHQALYPLEVIGQENKSGELTALIMKAGNGAGAGLLRLSQSVPEQEILNEEIQIGSLRVSDGKEKEAGPFLTGRPLEIGVTLQQAPGKGKGQLWIGIYRQDGVYCQGAGMRFVCGKASVVSFPRANFLPGAYKISVGILDKEGDRFLMLRHGAGDFRMVSRHSDHGTVYLPHTWKWKMR